MLKTPAPRQIVHVDMDAFYASVEQRDDPSLRGRPLIVGGPSRRGVVCTASYEARPFGVRSAMSMGEALRRCPEAVVVPPRMGHYGEISRRVMAILERFTPLVETLSLDEAFLDVTASRALFGDGAQIAAAIRAAITAELSLTASAGVATSKFVAKVASDLRKPDALVVVPEGEEEQFLAPLPVERMWGIGPKAAVRVRGEGFFTIGDLARAPLPKLRRALGTDWAETVMELARGKDARGVQPDREAMSIGAEETFERDLVDREAIDCEVLRQAERVASRLTASGLVARGVQVKVKYADFRLVTRRRTLPAGFSDTTTLHGAARELLDRVPLGREHPIRLAGVSAFKLTSGDAEQPVLFVDEAAKKRAELERVALRAAEKFGGRMIHHADALRRTKK
ncbi:MAG: DNA polymerase IV [Polyangiaceae bacterium]